MQENLRTPSLPEESELRKRALEANVSRVLQTHLPEYPYKEDSVEQEQAERERQKEQEGQAQDQVMLLHCHQKKIIQKPKPNRAHPLRTHQIRVRPNLKPTVQVMTKNQKKQKKHRLKKK